MGSDEKCEAETLVNLSVHVDSPSCQDNNEAKKLKEQDENTPCSLTCGALKIPIECKCENGACEWKAASEIDINAINQNIIIQRGDELSELDDQCKESGFLRNMGGGLQTDEMAYEEFETHYSSDTDNGGIENKVIDVSGANDKTEVRAFEFQQIKQNKERREEFEYDEYEDDEYEEELDEVQ